MRNLHENKSAVYNDEVGKMKDLLDIKTSEIET